MRRAGCDRDAAGSRGEPIGRIQSEHLLRSCPSTGRTRRKRGLREVRDVQIVGELNRGQRDASGAVLGCGIKFASTNIIPKFGQSVGGRDLIQIVVYVL